LAAVGAVPRSGSSQRISPAGRTHPPRAQVGKRLVDGLFQVELPPTRAHLVNNVTHWAYRLLNGALYGIVVESLPQAPSELRAALRRSVWVGDSVTLPAAKLSKPIWDYDAKTLAMYGLATATARQLTLAHVHS
jgi:hypothetical protein